MNIANPNYLHTAALLAQFAACGVRRVVLSPGARSTPLSLNAVQMGFDSYVLIDERSAVFFALGLAKADGVPPILICTSGTAAANYFPAVIEAAQSGVPLIVLSADRPAALRHTGAAQTIDQTQLYGKYARYFAELPRPAPTSSTCAACARRRRRRLPPPSASRVAPCRSTCRWTNRWPPFRKRSERCETLWAELQREGFDSVAQPAAPDVPEEVITRMAATLRDSLCGLIVAGPNAARTTAEAEAIFELAKQLGWPLLADIASGLRFYRFPVMAHYDVFLREPGLFDLAPDVVLAFGALPTSQSSESLPRAPPRRAHDPHSAARTGAGSAGAGTRTDCNRCRALLPRAVAPRESVARFALVGRVPAGLEHGAHGTRPRSADGRRLRGAVRLRRRARAARRREPRFGQQPLHPLCRRAGRRRGQAKYTRFVMRGANGIDGTLSHAAGVAAAIGRAHAAHHGRPRVSPRPRRSATASRAARRI